MVSQIFQIELLMSGFANLRFLKTNSWFGIISVSLSLISIGLIIALVVLSWLKVRLVIQLRKEIEVARSQDGSVQGNDNEEILDKKAEPAKKFKKELKSRIEASPSLKNWLFLIEDYSYNLAGYWMYIIVFFQTKEILVVLFVMIFIGYPYLQLVPCIVLSLVQISLILWKKPFKK